MLFLCKFYVFNNMNVAFFFFNCLFNIRHFALQHSNFTLYIFKTSWNRAIWKWWILCYFPFFVINSLCVSTLWLMYFALQVYHNLTTKFLNMRISLFISSGCFNRFSFVCLEYHFKLFGWSAVWSTALSVIRTASSA